MVLAPDDLSHHSKLNKDSKADFKSLSGITRTSFLEEFEKLKENSKADFKSLNDITNTSFLEEFEKLKEHLEEKYQFAINLNVLLHNIANPDFEGLFDCSSHLEIRAFSNNDTLPELRDSYSLGKYNNLNNYLHQQYFHKSTNVILNGYKCELTKSNRSIIEKETCRVMISIDMVASKAIQVFGLEKTQIFFDLMDEKLFDFELPVINSEFVLSMALCALRQHVLSFFIHAVDILHCLTLLLCCCPDSESLQKMTEKEFRSLMERVIDSSSLKTKGIKGAKPSLKVIKGIKWIMVDSEEFMREVGEEISEDILDRHGRGDEMIVQKLIDTRRQSSDGKENRPIHAIYFPSDCRLFIYIPTENGSYWHQSDLRRASRIHRQN